MHAIVAVNEGKAFEDVHHNNRNTEQISCLGTAVLMSHLFQDQHILKIHPV